MAVLYKVAEGTAFREVTVGLHERCKGCFFVDRSRQWLFMNDRRYDGT